MVYICCEAVNDTSIGLAYLSTCTYKSSREEGIPLIISLMSDIRVEGAQFCQHKLLIHQYKRLPNINFLWQYLLFVYWFS